MSCCFAVAVAVDKKVVRPLGAEPSASWSHGVLVADTLYISGMGGEDLQARFPTTSKPKRSRR